ncbi:MAG: glycosyltransferase family 2 protein [Sulfolobales archaeon]
MRSLVVSFITKDSYTKLREFGLISLEDVLNSTLQVPYKTIILVDDSSDATREVFKKWCEMNGKELVITESKLYGGFNKPTRAIARQTAINLFLENFSEEFLMFVDDDVILKDGWWNWVEENKVLEDEKVGEVWGISWDPTPERELFLKFFGINLKDYLIKKFYERGGTHDTIYRRKALEKVVIPPELHMYEDAYLHKWVAEHGWKSAINPVGVLHYHPTSYWTTDLKREKEKLRIAIQAALNYGIVEYETVKPLVELSKQSGFRKIVAYLSLIKPILGFFPMALVSIKVAGFQRGLKEALIRQYLKLWVRYTVLRGLSNRP